MRNIALLVVAIALTGCAPPASDAVETPGPATTTPPATASQPATVTVTIAIPSEASKDEVSQVIDRIIRPRVSALGATAFTVSAGATITVTIEPQSSITETLLAQVLHNRGYVSIVGLPKAQFGDMANPRMLPGPGSTIAVDLGVLLATRADIASATLSPDGTGNLTGARITFAADADQRIAEYTAAHTSEFVAVLIDGRVFSVPYIQSAIRDGMVVTGTVDSDPRVLVALLAADPLPAGYGPPGN